MFTANCFKLVTLFTLTFLSTISTTTNTEGTLENLENILNHSRLAHLDLVVCPKSSTRHSLFHLIQSQTFFSLHQVSLIEEIELETAVGLLKEDGNEKRLNTALVFQPNNLSFIHNFKTMMHRYYANVHGKYDDQFLLLVYWPEEALKSYLQNKDNEEKSRDEDENSRGKNSPYTALQSLSLSFPLDSQMYLITTQQFHHHHPHPHPPPTSQRHSPSAKGRIKRDYAIWEIFSVKDKSMIQRVNYLRESLSASRQNFNQAPIVAVSVGMDKELNDPVAAFSNDSGEIRFTEGATVRILMDLADSYNFSVKARLSDSYISVLPNGTVDGDGELLVSGEADLSIYLSYIIEIRSRHLQPLIPVCRDRIRVFFRRPPANSARNIFTAPFSEDLWAAIIGTACLMYISMFTIIFVQRKTYPESCFESSLELNDTIMWVLGVVCQQGYFISNWLCSQKIVLSCSLFASVALYAAYCCSIISTLALDEEPVKDVEDILEQDFTILAEPDVNYADYIFNETTQGQRARYRHKLDNYTTDVEAVRKIYEGHYAFLSTLDVVGPLSQANHIPDNRLCSELTSIPLGGIKINCGFHIAKGSPFKEHFNVKLLQIMEKGLNAKYLGNLYDQTKTKCPNKPKTYTKISMRDVFTAFFLFFGGFLASSTILLLERLFVHLSVRPAVIRELTRLRAPQFRRKRQSILIYITEH